MGSLPLRPIVFVPLYLLAWSITLVPYYLGLSADNHAEDVSMLGTSALQLWWCYRSVRFLRENTSGKVGRREVALMKCLLAAIALLFAYGFLYDSVALKQLVGTNFNFFLGTDSIFFIGAGALSYAAVLWISARALCDAEGPHAEQGVVVSFVLFSFIFVGAPVLYGRLKRLKDRGSDLRDADH